MNAITNFAFEENLVRVVTIDDDDPWFVAADIARVLGFRDAANAIRTVPDEEKGTHKVSTPGGDQELIVVSEPGLYRLIFRSNKPEAERFQHFVFHEVLPSLRKTGSFALSEPESSGIPFLDPHRLKAPLGVRVAAVTLVLRTEGRDAARAAMREYGLGDFSAVGRQVRAERGRECLTHLLAAKIDDGLSVKDHIQVAYAADDSMHAPLWNNGIRAIVGPPSGILVATNGELLRAVFSGTEWAGGRHSAALRSLQGAHSDRNQKFPGGAQSTTVFLPIGLITNP